MAVNHFFKVALAVLLFFLTRWLPTEWLPVEPIEEQRTIFLRAEKLVEEGHDADFLELGEKLSDYPLYPYLQYEWLKKHLQKTDKVTEFLARYGKTRYGILLRGKWLDYLAKHGRWQAFVEFYQGAANTVSECHYFWALHETGEKSRALDGAKQLWLTGVSQPQACDALFAEFMRSSDFSHELIWQRFELAMNEENGPLLDYLRRLLDASEQKTADFWLQVYKKPYLVKDSGLWVDADAITGRIFAGGIIRLAAIDLDLALQLWDGRKQYLTIDRRVFDDVDKKLAMALFNHRDSRAYSRLQQVRQPDEKIREAKIRAALVEQNWQHVSDALAALPWAVQQEPAWQYWRARTLAAMGEAQAARSVYLQLADDRSFYGFLAADTVGNGYTMGDNPVPTADDSLDSLLKEPEFKAVAEWRRLNREVEARRHWWAALEGLDKGRLRLAAKLAQHWQWDQIAIMTLVKADYWDDVALRFPLRYVDDVRSNATRQSLDPAIILGLMRQESMLDSHALSAVGAKGLMQLMPSTAEEVAAKLDEAWRGDEPLFTPTVNIRYGSYYFAELLRRFNGHVAVAVAAYNAGPNRAAKWLPMNRPIPADIWIETIPYKETRKYVTSVLSYAMIYQYRLQTNALKLKNMLTEIAAN